MENKEESGESKASTKSFRRRQRRREAAALQKLAASVISQKIESSVELPKKLSEEFDKFLNESSAPDGTSKNKSNSNNSKTDPELVSVRAYEKPKCEKVINNKISEKSKESNISHSGPVSNDKEDSAAGDTSAKRTGDKEKKSSADSIKTDDKLPTHEPCPSVKTSCSPRNLKSRNSKNQPQVSVIDLKASVSVQESYCNCKHGLIEPFKDTIKGECNLGKVGRNNYLEHGEVKEKQKDLVDSSKKKKAKPVNKGTDISVTQNLQVEEKSKKKTDTSPSKAKPENIQNAVQNSKNSVSEALNLSNAFFQMTGSSCDNPKVHLEITLKEQPQIPENLNNHLSDSSFACKMDKASEKVSDKKQGFNNKAVDIKCASRVTDDLEGKNSAEAESIKDAADREKVKAEREARKAAKLMKKQKDKVVKDKGEVGKEKDKVVKDKDKVVKDKDEVGKEKDKVVKDKDEVGKEKDKLVKETDKIVKENDKAVKEADKIVKEKDKTMKDVDKVMKGRDKSVKENGDVRSSTEVSSPGKTDDKSGGPVHKNDSLSKPAQEGDSNVGSKSKAELRAERRAKQEAQRAAKAAAASSSATAPAPKKASVADRSKSPKTQRNKRPTSRGRPGRVVRAVQPPKLINRFGLGESRSQRKENSLLDTQSIHPAIVQLGTRFTDRIISGSNARCIAFVQAIKKAIQDYETPPQKELARDLEACLLTPSLEYLEAQRPHAVSVLNATRFLKWQLTQLQPHHDSSSEKKVAIPDETAKLNLIEGLDSYIWEKIEVAEKAVCLTLMDKIKNGDVILTYGCSYLLQQIFLEAKKAGSMFKVVVVDGRPWKEGREMLRSLVSAGIPCSYVLLSAASSVMRQVNKVILGAHALLSNGYVMSRVGVSQVALLASAHNVPVLVACETHKFCERVQSDSFVYNEMGEPDGLTQLLGGEEGPLAGRKNLPHLSLLNLSYDVTPPELVTAVATELAVLPCTSVPVVLRVRPMEPVTCRH